MLVIYLFGWNTIISAISKKKYFLSSNEVFKWFIIHILISGNWHYF